MKPSVGRIVHYRLTEQDAAEIERRRTTRQSIKRRIDTALWPEGAQAHIGNGVFAGEVYPAIVVRVWQDTPQDLVNLQVFLDGSDVLWKSSVPQAMDEPADPPALMGYWFEPPRVPQVKVERSPHEELY